MPNRASSSAPARSSPLLLLDLGLVSCSLAVLRLRPYHRHGEVTSRGRLACVLTQSIFAGEIFHALTRSMPSLTAPVPFGLYLSSPVLNLEDPQLMSKLKAAIPAHCFEKSVPRSLYYMVRDMAIVALLYYFHDNMAHNWLNYILWANLTGFFGWAWFVVGHDCGHGTFSDYWLLNQICGHIMHTPLLVPFNGWQISHYKHHRYHNHIEKDETWRPLTQEVYLELDASGGPWTLLRRSPIKLFMYPWYLISVPDFPTFSGSHFDPRSRLFQDGQRTRAAVSSASVILWLVFLFATFRVTDLVWYYFVPYVIFTVWLSLITYLQHSDPKGRYYDERKWSFANGAMTTFDRSFGSVINHLHHNIETHLVHHFFFTAIPHYHLVEATEAVKPLLGDRYPYDDTNIVAALWNSLENCEYVTSPKGDGVFDHTELAKRKQLKNHKE